MKPITKYIEEFYPEYINLGENKSDIYNGVHGQFVTLDNGEEWYLRFWSPRKKGGQPQLHYTKKKNVTRISQTFK